METLEQDQQNQIQIKNSESLPLASIFERAVAFVIDLMLWASVSSFVYIISNISRSTLYVILSMSVFTLYVAIFSTGNLKTIGKFLMGIKVIDRKTKQNLTFGRALLRGIGYIINFFTFLDG